jgi:hypothetical protein
VTCEREAGFVEEGLAPALNVRCDRSLCPREPGYARCLLRLPPLRDPDSRLTWGHADQVLADSLTVRLCGSGNDDESARLMRKKHY